MKLNEARVLIKTGGTLVHIWVPVVTATGFGGFYATAYKQFVLQGMAGQPDDVDVACVRIGADIFLGGPERP